LLHYHILSLFIKFKFHFLHFKSHHFHIFSFIFLLIFNSKFLTIHLFLFLILQENLKKLTRMKNKQIKGKLCDFFHLKYATFFPFYLHKVVNESKLKYLYHFLEFFSLKKCNGKGKKNKGK
jgi:hypothetical protein